MEFYEGSNLGTKVKEAFRVLQASEQGIWKNPKALIELLEKQFGGSKATYGKYLEDQAEAFLKQLGFTRK